MSQEKKPGIKEAKLRIKLLSKRYSSYNTLKSNFMITTSGYSDLDFDMLYFDLNNKSKHIIQKDNLCYFCSCPDVVKHHLTYSPEILVLLCASCHQKLHILMQEHHKHSVKHDFLNNKNK